jgi:hypothetical protein
VTLAFWVRYPNPFANHGKKRKRSYKEKPVLTFFSFLSFTIVLAVDVLDRYVDERGVLKTTRLVLKKGKAPKWFPQTVRMKYVLKK